MRIRLILILILGIILFEKTLVVYNLEDDGIFQEYQIDKSQVEEEESISERNQYPKNEKQGSSSSVVKRRGHGQLPKEEDGENPEFPPQSDSFWEAKEKSTDGDGDDKSYFDETKFQNPSTSQQQRPNIILILTDDQDIELGSMEYMPETLKVFRKNGVEFRHGYVTTPMCCPSRTSMLTGLYVHNHQVYTNNDNCSSIQWREKFEKKTFAAYLHEAGYYTSYIGKYLNKYDGSHIPAGWDEWNALLMNSKFYNYTVNRNGQNIRYGSKYERDYYPDSIANDTIDFLRRMGSPNPVADDTKDEIDDDILDMDEDEDNGESSREKARKKFRKLNQPFLLVVSFPSPHGPEDSAPQYSNLFMNETPHHTPAYDFAPNSDKQWILQVTPRMNSNLKDYTNLLMSKRLQTLQSVDAAVKNIMDTLRTSGLEDQTYIFYTSDHGYHVGQFGLIKGKSMPFEFDIRVPFFLKAPSNFISSGLIILEPVLNIDLAPTFLDFGGVPIPPHMDGRSMLPLLQKYSKIPSSSKNFLDWTYTFLVESSGRREGDEHATKSKHNPPTHDNSPMLAESKIQLMSEEGKTQLNELCDLHPHPCTFGQKKYCKKEKDRVRFRKCRSGLDFELQSSIPKMNQCICTLSSPRSKRSSLWEDDPENFDWEAERRKIDDEIEALKTRIDELRERKRMIRHQLLAGSNSYVPFLDHQNNGSEQIRGKKKSNQIHNVTVSPSSFGNNFTVATKMETTEMPMTKSTSTTTPITIPDDIEEEEEIEFNSPDFENRFLQTTTTANTPNMNNYMKNKNNNESLFTKNRNWNMERGRKKFSSWEIVDERGIIIDDEDCDCDKLLNDPRWLRQREREERKKKKLISKIRKKQRFLNRILDPNERIQAETCGSEENMNCFWHDRSHWRTAPLWEGESFCFCMNSNNNTFSCLRSINSTHNYIYCQFITGFKMYFDLGRDPFQLRNAIGNLSTAEEDWMIDTLIKLKQCQGQECSNLENPQTTPMTKTTTSIIVGNDEALEPTIWEKIFGTRFRRKKNRNGRQKKNNHK